VPNLVLQPLVENAIKHGMARRTASGRLVISAERLNGNLTLRVEDDGPGPGAAGPDPVGGLGLRNVRARLQQLYGAEHRLTLEPGREGGAVATVTLPFHLAPLAATRGIDG
jgi:two-component system LytT family sensor kinase